MGAFKTNHRGNNFGHLKIESENARSLHYQLLDSKSSILIHKEIISSLLEIDFHNYFSGVYLLEVLENQNVIRTFQILKQ